MRILALDTSQIQASVCLLDGSTVHAFSTGSVDVAHSESLLRHIHELLNQGEWPLESIEAFAAGVGPGSFTGIRIGCATVKALAQVLGKPVIPFSSLLATQLSSQSSGEGASGEWVAFVNAYQGQVFAGWRDAAGHWQEDALVATEWRDRHFAELAQKGPVWFCGSGAKLYWSQLDLESRGAHLAPADHISALGIARAVGLNRPVGYLQLTANYLRPSQAEAKLAQRQA